MQKDLDQWRKRTESLLRQRVQKFRKGKAIAPISKTVRIYKNGYRKGEEPDIEFGATEEKLVNSIRSSSRKKKGVLDRVQFTMAYHSRFRESGSGWGRKNDNPEPFAKKVIETEIPKLADIISNDFADKTLSAIKF